MVYDFDHVPNRRGTNCIKWDAYPEDVLPLWVADTDFAVCPKITEALSRRIAHPVFGYAGEHPELRKVVHQRMAERYGWNFDPEAIVIVPGIVSAFNFAVRAFCGEHDSVIYLRPSYPPIIAAPGNNHQEGIPVDMVYDPEKDRYEVDFEAFEAAIQENTRLFILCNPENPTGRVFSREELLKFADICQRHNVLICSDEIHSEIVYPGNQHIPLASLSKEISAFAMTLTAPGKTFNIPNITCAFAIIENPQMRETFVNALAGLRSDIFGITQEAALAAYRDCADWHAQELVYLESNRDFAIDYIREKMPMLHVCKPEATFLLWLDCSALPLGEEPADFFEREARVALNKGGAFGPNFIKFVRLNLGTSRAILTEALDRMAAAVAKLCA